MNPVNHLELSGEVSNRPFAEVVSEACRAGLSGSLRYSDGAFKAVVYFDQGSAVFAVSNARAHRVAPFLIRNRDDLRNSPVLRESFNNDFELVERLEQAQAIETSEIELAFTELVTQIVGYILPRQTGEWKFDPLARFKGQTRVRIDVQKLLLQYGRGLPANTAGTWLENGDAKFQAVERVLQETELEPTEAFILYRFSSIGPQRAADVLPGSGIDVAEGLKLIYGLWLGGYLSRTEWEAAFPESRIATWQSAKLEVVTRPAPAVKKTVPTPKTEPIRPADIDLSLAEYLSRVETGTSHYELLGVSPESDLAAVRSAYFALAKMFHPDRFHKEEQVTLRRIQSAFTHLAQAHEILRNPDSRKAYDIKLRNEQPKASESGKPDPGAGRAPQAQQARAEEDFEQGFELVRRQNFEEAIPFLARAVFYAPARAEFHAYYGRALSEDEKQRHKAESEMQAAIKLEPKNPAFRLMLAEFFERMNLTKRAVGELRRLLEIDPDNAQAKRMLERLSGV